MATSERCSSNVSLWVFSDMSRSHTSYMGWATGGRSHAPTRHHRMCIGWFTGVSSCADVERHTVLSRSDDELFDTFYMLHPRPVVPLASFLFIALAMKRERDAGLMPKWPSRPPVRSRWCAAPFTPCRPGLGVNVGRWRRKKAMKQFMYANARTLGLHQAGCREESRRGCASKNREELARRKQPHNARSS